MARWAYSGLRWLALVLVVAAARACTREGPCRCRSSEGLLDLTPALLPANAFFETAAFTTVGGSPDHFEATQYYFHPCTNSNINRTDGKNTCTSTSICKRNVQINKDSKTNNITMKDDGYLPVADAEHTSFTSKGDEISLIYPITVGVTVTIQLVCSKSSKSSFTIINNDPNNPVFAFYSAHACLVLTASEHSLGTSLLIIFFVIVAVYLIAGVCVKHFLMGARGIEVIPNLNFWKDLPLLVKDGVAFIQNGFKPPVQTASSAPNPNPNPNTYDSI